MNNFELRKILINMGISANLQGFNYIITAVEFIKIQKIHTNMDTVYSEIAKKFDTTPSAVERSIRHAKSKAYKSNKYLNKIYCRLPDNSAIIYNLVFNFDIIKSYFEGVD